MNTSFNEFHEFICHSFRACWICPNEGHALGYGFIDITLEVLILSFDTLITKDLAYD